MSSTIPDGRSEPTRSQPDFSSLPLILSPTKAAHQLSLSRYTVYELIRSKRLRARRYGRILLIPRSELERFISTLERK
jgi:excisionase family DNA binding protein